MTESNQAKFCYKCGRQLGFEDLFCQQCGAEVGAFEEDSQFYGTEDEENVPNFIPPSVIDEAETVIARRHQTPIPPVKETFVISPAPVVIEKPSQTNKALAIALGIVSVFAVGLGFLLYLNLSRQNATTASNVNIKIATPTRTPQIFNSNVNSNSNANSNANAAVLTNLNNNAATPDITTEPTLAPTPPDPLPAETVLPTPTPETAKFRFGTRTFEGAIGGNYEVTVNITRVGNVLKGDITPKNGGKTVLVEGFIEDDSEFVLRELDSTRLITGVYEGKMDEQNNLSGFWSKPDGSAKRRFSFATNR